MSSPQPPTSAQAAPALNSQTTTGTPLSDIVWDLDRSSALGTLKAMIRERMSPESASSIRVQAMVVSANAGVPPIIETVYGQGGGDVQFQMIRIRVVSDARHYWLPQPQTPDSPYAGFYPVIKHDLTKSNGHPLVWGQFIEVQFYDNKTQFTSHMEVGDTVSLLPSSYLSEYKTSYSDQTKHGFVGANCSVRIETTTEEIEIEGARSGPDGEIPAVTESRQITRQIVEGCGKIEQMVAYAAPSPPTQRSTSDPTAVKPHWPAPDKTVTSKWNPSRTVTRNGQTETRPHNGIDIRAPWGTPIFAVLDGVVNHRIQSSGPGKGFGYYIIITHDKYSLSPDSTPIPITTLYAHLQNPSIVPIVSENTSVRKGQIIGISAASGKTVPPGIAGAHLHFELLQGTAGTKVDPLPFLKGELYLPKGAN